MNMQEQIAHMIEQFSWKPKVERYDDTLSSPRTVVVCGMGGSHLAAEIFAREAIAHQFIIHHDYGLPILSGAQKHDVLVLISSYSGDTEETLSALTAAQDENLPIVVMTSGGILLERARTDKLPAVILPREDIEPRMTLGYMLRGLAYLFNDEQIIDAIASVGKTINNTYIRTEGRALAENLIDKIPVFYASQRNMSLAYILKATFNETAKVPSFWGTIPEACHNELAGYESSEIFASTAQKLHPIFVTDVADHPRVSKRMSFVQELIEERNLRTSTIGVSENLSSFSAGIQVVLIGTWAAVFLARHYNVPDAKTPIIASLKEMLAKTP